MKYVNISTKVERRIEALKQSGKTGKVIAQKVRDTIENIKSGTIHYHTAPSGTFTKYGEKRIKNCRKFDFGCGYRMITLHKDLTVFIPFLGTHDECQRWLENNSKLKEITIENGAVYQISETEDINENPSEDYDENTFDDLSHMNLSEQDMRNVFCGIVEGAKKRQRL